MAQGVQPVSLDRVLNEPAGQAMHEKAAAAE
jgi:hypothetical protein